MCRGEPQRDHEVSATLCSTGEAIALFLTLLLILDDHGMGELLGQEVQAAIAAAATEARRVGSDALEPVHLLLGVLHVGSPTLRAALEADHVDAGALATLGRDLAR